MKPLSYITATLLLLASVLAPCVTMADANDASATITVHAKTSAGTNYASVAFISLKTRKEGRLSSNPSNLDDWSEELQRQDQARSGRAISIIHADDPDGNSVGKEFHVAIDPWEIADMLMLLTQAQKLSKSAKSKGIKGPVTKDIAANSSGRLNRTDAKFGASARSWNTPTFSIMANGSHVLVSPSIKCDCSDIPFIRWILKNMDKFYKQAIIQADF